MIDINNIYAQVLNQFKNLDPHEPGMWPIIPRVACGVLVALATLVVGNMFYWSEQVDRLHAGQAQQQKLQDEYKIKYHRSANLEMLRKKKEVVSQYVASLERQLPSKAEMDELLSDINRAGIGRGLQFDLFMPGQVVIKDFYVELPINLKIVGRYHDIGAFTSDIANLPRIVTLNNINLIDPKNSSGLLSFEVVAKTFRYLDADEILQQRKVADEKKAKEEKDKGAKK